MLPETFSEQLLRIYCKKDDIRGIEMLKKVFADWCKATRISLYSTFLL